VYLVNVFIYCNYIQAVMFTVIFFFFLSDDKKQDIQAVMNRDHDNDTPDTVISSSSPECVIPEFPIRFPGMVINLSETPLSFKNRASCI
jgi:hypothetical protein